MTQRTSTLRDVKRCPLSTVLHSVSIANAGAISKVKARCGEAEANLSEQERSFTCGRFDAILAISRER
jgi:hypothetical protein